MTIHLKKKIFFSVYCMFLSVVLIFLFSALIFILPGCKENSVENTGTATNDNVSIGFYSENESGDNTLVITEAKFVIRKLMLKREDHGGDCDVNLGPFVVYLDLTSKVAIVAVARIPLGRYDEVMFQIHKPNPNENVGDPEFNEGSSNHNRFSVITRGFYNNNPFVYRSHVTVAKEIEFENLPIEISTNEAVANVTIRLKPYSWFIKNGMLLDPTDESNSHEIDKNIKNSLRRAFRDLDCNGEPD